MYKSSVEQEKETIQTLIEWVKARELSYNEAIKMFRQQTAENLPTAVRIFEMQGLPPPYKLEQNNG